MQDREQGWGYENNFLPSVNSLLFSVIEILVTYWILCSYQPCITAAELLWHLTDMSMIQKMSDILNFHKRETMNAALVTPPLTTISQRTVRRSILLSDHSSIFIQHSSFYAVCSSSALRRLHSCEIACILEMWSGSVSMEIMTCKLNSFFSLDARKIISSCMQWKPLKYSLTYLAI